MLVTTLPTSPFPELKPLDERRQVPSLAELLTSSSSLPVETPATQRGPKRPALRVPRFPNPVEKTTENPITPGALDDMPVAKREVPTPPALAEYMADDPLEIPQSALPTGGSFPRPAPAAPAPAPASPTPRRSAAPVPALGTDDELKDALLPVLEETLTKALYAPETGLHTYLEPMLRSTVRRAIAEQLESSRQFGDIGTVDRLAWRLSALFTSRSYDEIVFDRTRRYQVEEVFLLRKKSKSLISYASHDAVRHASTRRVQSTFRMLTSNLRDADDRIRDSFDLPERRVALVRNGSHTLLVAILRGSSNALVRADLDYIQRQAEERFGTRLNEEGEAFIHVLQPILEGCLLIQSPAPPR